MRHVLLVLAVALIAASCGSDDPQAGGDPTNPPASPSAEPSGGNQTGDQDGDQGGGQDDDQGEDQADPEDLAPDFTVETFEGDTFQLSEHRGVPVVLNFWESW